MTQAELLSIAQCFALEGKVTAVAPLGSGLINDTFKVETDAGRRYVLQRINNAVFPDVALLQSNIAAVTRHIRAKLEAAGECDIDRKVLRFLPLRDSDATFLLRDGKYWRVSAFIEDSFTFDTVDALHSYQAGDAFGRFEAMLADLPETLGETIPDFHNMELRARQLRDAVAADRAGRMALPEVKALVEDIFACEEEMCKAERMHREGKLPKRVCHCDTKVSNMLFDADGSVLCVIDLDTVMPSFVFSDYGDFLRTAANTTVEDDPDLSKVGFNREIFEAFTKGYIGATRSFLTAVERENLPYAVTLFPYMQAVRFLTDYINGDTYYKIKYPEHNLVRTRNQWKLFRCTRAAVPEMTAYLNSLPL
ncbi:MAG: aminoglycoside phosphotransferase family protein [Bacteroidales bacterium]|nr:aminoglycoside phosphotransferase family protein [Bacteroidales bacterium]